MKYFDDLEFAMADMLENTDLHLNLQARFYGIQYIHEGSMDIKINGNKFHIEAPVVFHTYPGAVLEYNPNGATYKRSHYWICFQGDRVKKFIDGGLMKINPEQPFFSISDPDRFLHMIHELIVLINTGYRDKAVLLLENVLFHINEQEDRELKLPVFYSGHIKKLLIEIMRKPQYDWNFENEAAKLHITLNHFNRVFRKMAKTSPQQFVIRNRMQSAAKFLSNTLMSIKEVSLAVGIDNGFYFSRLFKKKFFMSPVAYRRKFSKTSNENSTFPKQ